MLELIGLLSILSILLCSVPFAHCQINSTMVVQDQPVDWQAESKHRGTWGIIANCLTTIIAGTWSIQHLNVPLSSDGSWSRRWRSVKWMAITILFPEFMVVHALFELLMAIEALQTMKNSATNKSNKSNKSVELPWWWLSPPQLPSILLTRMKSFRKSLQIAHNNDENLDEPDVTVENIQDLSKTDLFVKIIAAIQFLQLVSSLIVRTTQSMAFSQLETLTVGFAVCGFLTYLFYFYKPQGVKTNLETKKKFSLVRNEKTFDSFWDVLINKKRWARISTKVTRIPNDNITMSQNQWGHPGIFVLALASALFGAMHAIAWDFEFPSVQEKMLWHIATIIAVASPVAGLLLIPVAQLTISSVEAHAFIGDFLRLLREFSWHTQDKGAVNEVYKQLQNIYIVRNANSRDAQISFKQIFSEADPKSQLPDQLLAFLNAEGDWERIDGLGKLIQESFTETFKSEFYNLVLLMKVEESKKPDETAKTNVFPRSITLPNWLNLCVLYSASVLYILARLSLLAVGFSSLRRMPASVYVNTPWTAYIPSVG
ncbi:preprotein translocase subunit YidC [Apiospora arundinis]